MWGLGTLMYLHHANLQGEPRGNLEADGGGGETGASAGFCKNRAKRQEVGAGLKPTLDVDQLNVHVTAGVGFSIRYANNCCVFLHTPFLPNCPKEADSVQCPVKPDYGARYE